MDVRVKIQNAISDTEIMATFSVMHQLRPHLVREEYLDTIKRMQELSGYRLAAVVDGEQVRCVSGYRVLESLAWGRFLYVDDLITDAAGRSKGYGRQMLDWLATQARESGCGQLHLDSGVQRPDAHRFYFREGMGINCYHFARML